MKPRIGYVCKAAQGLLPGGTPTGRDILDLLDVDLWSVRRPKPTDWSGPMMVAMFGLLGAFPEEIFNATTEDFPGQGADQMPLRSSFGIRVVPVIGLARHTLTEGTKALRGVSQSDRLIIGLHGKPFRLQGIKSRFSYFAGRVGLDGVSLPVALRSAFQDWVRASNDSAAIRRLCKRGRAEAARLEDPELPVSHLRRVLEEFHPLGKTMRPLLQHVGAVDRAFPNRDFAVLSPKALRELKAARTAPPRDRAFPNELVQAVLSAWDAGRRISEIAAHYDISEASVDRWIRKRAGTYRLNPRTPETTTEDSPIVSTPAIFREGLVTYIRSNPDQTFLDVQQWVEDQGFSIERSKLYGIARTEGLQFASGRGILKRKCDRDAFADYLREHPRASVSGARSFLQGLLGHSVSDKGLEVAAAGEGVTLTTKRLRNATCKLLLAYVAEHPENTLPETIAWLRKTHGISIKVPALHRLVRRHNLAYKPGSAWSWREEAAAGPEQPTERGRHRKYRRMLDLHGSVILDYVRANPNEKISNVLVWAHQHLGVELGSRALSDFLEKHGVRISQPRLILLRAHLLEHPQQRLKATAAWLAEVHGIEISVDDLRKLVKRLRHTDQVTESSQDNEARSDSTEPERPEETDSVPPSGPTKRRGAHQLKLKVHGKAILEHARAHPGMTIPQFVAWVRDHLGVDLPHRTLRTFLENNGAAPPSAYWFAVAADRLLLDYLCNNPTASPKETRLWISERLGRPVADHLVESFARRHRHRFPSIVTATETVTAQLLEHIRANPGETANELRSWAKQELGIEESRSWFSSFAKRHKVKLGTKTPLSSDSNAKALAEFMAANPAHTVPELQAWCLQTFRREVDHASIRAFARRQNYRVAQVLISPNREPYRSELLAWLSRHPKATTVLASRWLFERFGLDVDLQVLRRFAKVNGFQFPSRQRQPHGTARTLRRKARLAGLRNTSRKRTTTSHHRQAKRR